MKVERILAGQHNKIISVKEEQILLKILYAQRS